MNNDLMSLLYQSSHFLHHRRGGKRGQRKILTLLTQNPGISQKELQDRLGIESGSMSELVIKLEHKGLITRTKDDIDKRMSKLTITELGSRMSKELEDLAAGEEQLLLSSLDAGEQEQLQLLLSKLVTNWEEAYDLRGEGRHHRRCDHHSDHDHHGGDHEHGDHEHGDHGHGDHRHDDHRHDDHRHDDHKKDEHHSDHDHHSDRSTHDEDDSHHHHGHDRDLDHRGHHFRGKEHEKHHHHRHN